MSHASLLLRILTRYFAASNDQTRGIVMSGTAAAPSVAEPEATTANEESAGPSKSELKKRAKEAEKAKKVSERAAREDEEKKKREAAMSVDHAAQNYGKLPLHQSQERNGTLWFTFD